MQIFSRTTVDNSHISLVSLNNVKHYGHASGLRDILQSRFLMKRLLWAECFSFSNAINAAHGAFMPQSQ